MTRITIAVDIAGRPTRETAGNPRVTAAAAVIPAANLDRVRSAIPAHLPKWKSICNVVCDQEFSGEENIEVFKSFWDTPQIPLKSLESFGFKVTHPNVMLVSDDNEPLLQLADIAAGLLHSAHIPDPGLIRMPIAHDTAKRLLMPLLSSGLLSIDAFDYDASYDQIFGDVMQAARGT